MTQVLASHLPAHHHAVLSGPSFAVDLVRGLPTAVTIAAPTMGQALQLSQQLSSDTLRCYASDDVIGVEWGGALKNVLAIAAGITAGRKLGASATAAVTTRGFAELQRIALALGARPETLAGLSGLGDLILTCGSEKSRNFSYGLAIGRGDSLDGLRLAEGAHTAAVATKIARENNIDAPLLFAVCDVLDKRITVDQAIATLLARPLKPE